MYHYFPYETPLRIVPTFLKEKVKEALYSLDKTINSN